jgi:hypothetical protein
MRQYFCQYPFVTSLQYMNFCGLFVKAQTISIIHSYRCCIITGIIYTVHYMLISSDMPYTQQEINERSPRHVPCEQQAEARFRPFELRTPGFKANLSVLITESSGAVPDRSWVLRAICSGVEYRQTRRHATGSNVD